MIHDRRRLYRLMSIEPELLLFMMEEVSLRWLLFLLLLWLQKFLVCLVLFQLCIVAAVVFVILVVLIVLLLLLMIANVIRVQVIPFVAGHRDEIAIAFAGYVDRYESTAELVAEIHEDGRRRHGLV